MCATGGGNGGIMLYAPGFRLRQANLEPYVISVPRAHATAARSTMTSSVYSILHEWGRSG